MCAFPHHLANVIRDVASLFGNKLVFGGSGVKGMFSKCLPNGRYIF
jgi:hypothetical protein